MRDAPQLQTAGFNPRQETLHRDQVRAARVLVANATVEKLLRRKDGGFPGTEQNLGQLARKGCKVIFAGRDEVGL